MNVPLGTAWLLYQGLRLGLGRDDALHTRLGELLDLIDCDAIAHGAKVAGGNRSIDDILMNVR